MTGIVRTVDGKDMEAVEEMCTTCGDRMKVINKGLGRARLAAWRSRHQHDPGDPTA